MSRKSLLGACALLVAAFGSVASAAEHKILNTYYAQWTVYNGFTVKSLDTSGMAKHLDVLSYAFVNIGTNAAGQYECTSFDSWADNGTAAGATANTSVDGRGVPTNGLTGNFGQLLLLKQKHPNLRIVITIGGASLPPQAFAAVSSTAANRKHFVASCIADYIKGHFSGAFGQTPNKWETGVSVQQPPGPPVPDTPGLFDGIEIDWEYPTAADTANFTALMAEFRSQLDQVKKGYILSFDAPAGSWAFQNIQLSAVAQSCTYIDLMTYDYAGPWQNQTGFVAPLHRTKFDPDDTLNVDWSINAYIAAGVPPSKILMGIPFYGYAWTVESNSAMYKKGQFSFGNPLPSSGPAPLNTEGYSWIVANAVPAMQNFRDNTTNEGKTATPWLFDGSTFWTFDDQESIYQKTSYARAKELGGAFAWEASGDLPDASLFKAMYMGLNGIPLP
jgi:chitinase